jgi:hypothetical protein
MQKAEPCFSIQFPPTEEEIDCCGSGDPKKLLKLWRSRDGAQCSGVSTVAPTEQADYGELLLFDPRRLSEGDRKKECADRTCQDKDISNAFHVNIS